MIIVRRFVVGVVFIALSAQAQDRAVLIYPKERSWFRRLFYTTHQKEVRRQLESRFDLDVHEQVATAGDLLKVDVRGARLLVLSGHGDPFAMFLGGDKRRTLDWRDRERLRTFFAGLDPDATIVLQSCETGRGFAWAVKDAAGPRRRVIAAKGTVPRDGMQIVSLWPVEVRMTCRDGEQVWDCTVHLQ